MLLINKLSMVKVIQVNVGGFDSNFSYIVTKSDSSKNAIIIDPTGNLSVIETALKLNNLTIGMQLFTHSHPDHTELMNYFISKKVPTYIPPSGLVGKSKDIEACGLKIKVLHTPGHTQESVCFIIEENIFSGDTIFVKGIGTTAYGGNDSILKETLNYLSTLNPSLKLWPGHNYGGASSSLGGALKNSHIKPSDKILEIIKKKVKKYESEQTGNQKKTFK